MLSERIFYETYMLESFYTSTSLTHTVQESILDGKAGQYRKYKFSNITLTLHNM